MNDKNPVTGVWDRTGDLSGFPVAIQREGAWVPRPLPSDLPLRSETHRALAAAEQALGRLDEAAQRLPDRAALERHTMLREAQSSAAWENMPLALMEVLLAELPGAKAPRAEVAPVLRYLEASTQAFDAVRAGRRVDMDLLGKTSRLLLAPTADDADGEAGKTADGGFWRTTQSWVGGRTRDTAALLHTSPGPHLRAVMAQWEEWVADHCVLPLVGKIAIGHHQLEVIHPFGGGNGYVSRLYASLELVRAGALRDQVLPLSVWLDRNRDVYHAQLRHAIDTESFEEFIRFFAGGVREACLGQIELIRRMDAVRAKHKELISRAGNASRVAEGLIAMPVTNHRDIAKRFGMSVKNATEVARQLQHAGLLTVHGGKNYNKVFVCQDVLDLFTLNDPIPPRGDREVFRGRTS
ncbi:Fic family protein [Amycolatopsis nigrescens]|uniref:Fic family protein n=1 Tax=Amycolatopsis nigrescens TaxID=381445 RepID=UPI00047670B1|nr:Fic/DOC family N-terminal domain-containing protein [Amycolatopsis nigrescens]